MPVVRTQQGDTVDQVSLRHYGHTRMVEAILVANPGLAAHGATLPLGLAVTLPAETTKTKTTVNLWD